MPFLLVSLAIGFQSAQGALAIPAGARHEAEKFLATWLSVAEDDLERFRQAWGIKTDETDFSKARLEPAYVIYFMEEEQVSSYDLEGEGADILSFASVLNYAFPVTNKGQYIGTLLVSQNVSQSGEKVIEEAGDYAPFGGFFADSKTDRKILDMRKDFPVQRGYSISKLRTLVMGVHLVVESEKGIEFVIPVNKVGARILMTDAPSESGDYTIVSINDAVPLLKEAAREIRIRVEPRDEGDRE